MDSKPGQSRSRRIDAAIVMGCMLAVTTAAAVQLTVVMRVVPVAQFFAVPLALGVAFGALIVKIRRAIQRERELAAELAARESALADLNRELESKVVERTRDLERAHEQLIHAQKMEAVGRVAGGVAHDFNNMLTIMFGCAAELERTAGSDERQRAVVAELAAACERARQITRQLLIFSRREVACSAPVSLRGMLEELRPMLTRLAGKGVELRVAIESDQIASCDKGQLEQVVVNLVVNARDAGAKTVVLTVGQGIATDSGPIARLSVRDDGPGMSPETARRALEPFFTTKPSGQGTGLGLSVADSVIRAFGGSVDLSSTLGAGTTVTVRLPAEARAAEPVGMHSALQSGGERAPRLAILVVEDEAPVRAIMLRILQGAGYSVTAVETVQDAVQVMTDLARPVDALLTDYQLPDGTGAQVIDALARHRPGVPCLLTTGYMNADVERLADVPLLPKPFTPSELKARVAELMPARPARALAG
ncbi:MAG: response regulator [Myxococcales bacterium]|nr:response regulator [Myxococcales bacterium]